MMINTIALKEEAVGDKYELQASFKPPTDLKSATALLKSILTGRERNAEIKEYSSGAIGPPPGAAFAAAGGNGRGGCGDAAERANAAAASARTGNPEEMATLIADAVAAAVSKLVDPKITRRSSSPAAAVAA